MRAAMMYTASSLLRKPAWANFCWTASTWLCCSTFMLPSVSLIFSVVSVLRTRLWRFFALDVTRPLFSSSRRPSSALTRFAIGSRIVTAV